MKKDRQKEKINAAREVRDNKTDNVRVT